MTKKKKMTAEQEYQHDYYLRNKKKRTKTLKEAWKNDPRWRASEQERARERRGRLRSAKAGPRFEQMIKERRAAAERTRPPRFVLINRQDVQVWTSGSLGREVGRSPRTVRGWLRDGTLPGATAYVDGAAFFSHRFCQAVYLACERLYYLNGRGEHLVLKRLIREELAKEGISFVTLGADNETGRIKAKAVIA